MPVSGNEPLDDMQKVLLYALYLCICFNCARQRKLSLQR